MKKFKNEYIPIIDPDLCFSKNFESRKISKKAQNLRDRSRFEIVRESRNKILEKTRLDPVSDANPLSSDH